ncbi:MAG: hypothetical protein CMM52_09950 [Rhodospirillaceae bacterium]|nr:hypothetical protein [Rhodospirillaceae bacterium]|tara:strand:- start:8753 stop:9343 length:591 start_codon:yes stop_codon:yes gene_type:complete
MIDLREVSRSVFGAWMLARFNPDGLLLFENTVSAFWRSYWAAILALPAFIALVMMFAPEIPVAVGHLSAIIIRTSGYVAGWFLLPFIMFYVCRLIDREEQFCRYIAAYNWARLLQILLLLLVTILSASGVIPKNISPFVTFAAYVFVLIYQGFIVRVALMIPGIGAFGIVVMDLATGIVIEICTGRLLAGQSMFGG